MAEVAILGAGMIGVSSALELQARGHDVTLVDRRAPGRETSFGNAGIIQAEAAEPYALPRDLRTLLRYALRRDNDVTYHWGALARMAPALWQYFRHSAPASHARISGIYAQMTLGATADHAPWIKASGAEELIRRDGMMLVFRNPRDLDAAVADAARLRARWGVTSHHFDSTGLRAIEPALTDRPAGGLLMDQSWACSDPGGLVERYARLFTKRGGHVVRGDAETLQHRSGGWDIATDDGSLQAEHVVIALGPWSADLAARFGLKIQMVYKRGYHGHFTAPHLPNRPLVDADNGIVASPMAQGLRLATGAALVARNAPLDPRQLTTGARRIADILPIGPRIAEPQWLGTRPCMPDMLPVVGAAPDHTSLWVNFGHGHQGFTLGPTSARLLADAMDGAGGPVLDALSPARLRR
ncbi:NAD(P)/FAD-dependent oxidoreductase [Sagittula sp. SSi028]|uniref:NAD(P)/FAD-dependent oxidoreductase n=1 Tax=Sagittula sp. SSi028 TaxID=3400636 RepID=UPI003AF652AF